MTTPPAPIERKRYALIWIGPAGHTSTVFGPLDHGRTYTTDDADLAKYLVTRQTDYWRSADAGAGVEE